MERQISFELRAKRRVTYAFHVGNALSWEAVFKEAGPKNWSRNAWAFDEQSKNTPDIYLNLSDSNRDEVRLDWLVHMGGPMRSVFDAYCARRCHQAEGIQLSVFMAPDPVLLFEVQAWLAEFSKTRSIDRSRFRLSADRRWQPHLLKFGVEVSNRELDSNLSIDQFLQCIWADVVDEKLQPVLHQLSREQILEKMESEPPWSVCRHMGAKLKRILPETALSPETLFDLDRRGGLLAAFFSPQDEQKEAETLAAHEVMLNPTLEIAVRRSAVGGRRESIGDGPVVALGRYRDSMFEHEVSFIEAAIIEFVRESFRIQESAVCASVVEEFGKQMDRGGQEVYQSLQRLKFEGILLTSESLQNL